MDPWSLPGPASYLRQASEGLREGQNLVLAMPTHALDGLCEAIERQLHRDGWRLAGPVTDDASEPVDQIFAGLGLDDRGALRRSVSLLRQRLEPGQVVLVRGVGRAGWPLWRGALQDYEVASRGVSAFDRPLLVVLTEGVPIAALPVRAAALKVLPWQGALGELDMLLYATETLRERRALDFRTKLVARMISKLALWDLTLADHLLIQKPAALFRPAEAIGSARDQDGIMASLERSWESGGLQRFDGVEMAHPYLLLADGDSAGELNMRIWAAQAAEILPALELHRRQLATRMRTMVSLPIRLADQQISDLDDLEIGQLAHIAMMRRLNRSITQTADKWRRLRNKLAHLQSLEADDALDRELLLIGDGCPKR